MRFKLLRRRFGINAQRMTVRSHLPWPLRWALMALVLGLSGALALWAFEFGKGIAGLDSGSKEELAKLRAEVKKLTDERENVTSSANTAESRLKTERAAQAALATQVQTLEAENSKLKDDVRFFERLIPSNAGQADLAIRALQLEPVLARAAPSAASVPAASPASAASAQTAGVRYRMLVIQTGKNAPEFTGRFELVLAGLQNGKPWSQNVPEPVNATAVNYRLSFKSYQRVEGELPLPANTVVKSIQARVLDKNGTRATQLLKL
jgi:cell division protein FtsB